MNSCIIAFAFLATFTLSYCSSDDEWQGWKSKYEKVYKTEEDSYRKGIWQHNYRLIQMHNSANMSYKLELNQFADLTDEEFRLYYLANEIDISSQQNQSLIHEAKLQDIPSSKNWVDEGYVTQVKNQPGCACGWAFSATGAIEGQMYKTTGLLVSLSEQQLLDCSWEQGNSGCDGGYVTNAFQYVIDTGYICSSSSYPYSGCNNTCQESSCDPAGTCSSYKNVPARNEETMQVLASYIGPISATIDASLTSFRLYSGGVYYDSSCSSTSLNHGVLVVGYGTTTAGQDYWLVKNSWGTSWGDDGYVKMARNQNNNCGIASLASYPKP